MSLSIKNLSVDFGKKRILEDINLEIKNGKIHALMGPNGSGKSTFAQVLMGNPAYEIKNQKSKIKIDGKNILNWPADERARKGLFLSFQNPVPIPGVNVGNLLRTSVQQKQTNKNKCQQIKRTHNPALNVWQFNEMLVKKAKSLNIPQEFLRRTLNEEFSGGEKKKIEMLQALVLTPKYAVFDEIDTGLDVDALKTVAQAIYQLKKEGCGIIIITHYQRILKFAKPDKVFILIKGKIVAEGDYKLALKIEENGYKEWAK